MRKTIKKNSIIAVIITAICLVSCDSNRVFDEYKSVDVNGWKAENKILFNFSVEDTLAQRNLFIRF